MRKAKKSSRKPAAKSGLQAIGGTAAGAAVGSLMGPVGAAVGAVVGGIAGANVREIAESKVVKRVTAAARRKVGKARAGRAPVKSGAARKTPQRKK